MQNYVKYFNTRLNDMNMKSEKALILKAKASRNFARMFVSGNYDSAAKMAAESEGLIERAWYYSDITNVINHVASTEIVIADEYLAGVVVECLSVFLERTTGGIFSGSRKSARVVSLALEMTRKVLDKINVSPYGISHITTVIVGGNYYDYYKGISPVSYAIMLEGMEVWLDYKMGNLKDVVLPKGEVGAELLSRAIELTPQYRISDDHIEHVAIGKSESLLASSESFVQELQTLLVLLGYPIVCEKPVGVSEWVLQRLQDCNSVVSMVI